MPSAPITQYSVEIPIIVAYYSIKIEKLKPYMVKSDNDMDTWLYIIDLYFKADN